MKFVLVHGAWHDARCWDHVASLLRQQGHSVHTPTLTGLGTRADELTPLVGLGTHVADVVAAIDARGLSDEVILVGHSYAGVVVREAADRLGTRVSGLVLIEGWVADDGESMASVAPDWFMPAIRHSADTNGDGWRVPPPSASMFGVEDEPTAARLAELVSAHPLKTFTDPTTLRGAVDRIPCAAIIGRPGSVPFRRWATERGWELYDIDAGHDSMLTAPELLADTIEKAAAGLR